LIVRSVTAAFAGAIRARFAQFGQVEVRTSPDAI
jgi:hypothetical protein